jgi:threonine/homoserine/homoserine lactone efflux protein
MRWSQLMHEFAGFVAVSVLVVVTPGPDTALTIRNTLLAGRQVGVVTAFGVVTGQLTWALAASGGLAAIIVASATAFNVLKFAGAIYLVYLGARAVVSALGRNEAADDDANPDARATNHLCSRQAYRQGVISNLANPKAAVFFTSLLPQFAGRDGSFFAFFSLGVVMAAMTLVWLAVYASAVAKASDVLGRRRVRRAFEAVMGTALMALGVRLATEQR